MSDNAEPGVSFPSVSVETWRERAEAGRALREPPLLEGPTVRVLHTERAREERGRPGASPFIRGATPSGAVTLSFELDGPVELHERARAAVIAGAERLRVGPRACATLDEEGLKRLVDARGDAELVLAPGADAVAWSLRAPEGVRVVDDPLAVLARTGRLPCAGSEAVRRSAERAARAKGRPLGIDTRAYHEAGASPATEIAIAASSGLSMLRAFVDVEHPLADGPRKIAFTFALDSDVFMGAATLRAARWVWSKVLRTLGIDGPEQGMHIHASSSRRAASRLEPMNNALRGTTSAFAAYVGGANEISVFPHDDVTGAPTPAGDRLALTTLHLLRWESHLGRVIDPGGGSYHLETLTSALARQAWSELQEIEHHGGVLRGLLDGSLSERIRRTAILRSEAAATRRRGIVGASRYASPEPVASQTEPEALAELPDAPEQSKPFAALAAMNDASLDELRAALRGPGEPSIEPLPRVRLAAPFEALREASGAPTALLLCVGAPAETRARVDFTRDALAIAGIVSEVSMAEDIDAARPLVAASEAGLLALAAPDDALPDLVPALVGFAKVPIVVAAPPDDTLDGVLAFVHRKMDAIETLQRVLDATTDSEEASS